MKNILYNNEYRLEIYLRGIRNCLNLEDRDPQDTQLDVHEEVHDGQ